MVSMKQPQDRFIELELDSFFLLLCEAKCSFSTNIDTNNGSQQVRFHSLPSLIVSKQVTRSLRIERVQRQLSGTRIICRASNSELTQPKNVTAVLRLNREPSFCFSSTVGLGSMA